MKQKLHDVINFRICTIPEEKISISRKIVVHDQDGCISMTLRSNARLSLLSFNNKRKRDLLGMFDEKACRPLRALIESEELEDGRHFIQQYEKLWHEVESQDLVSLIVHLFL